MAINLEPLTHKLGNPGRFQVVIFFFLCLNYYPLVFSHVIMAFFAITPKHQCYSSSYLDPDQSHSVARFDEVTHVFTGNISANTTSIEKCKGQYVGPGEASNTVTCPDDDESFLIYQKGSEFSSIVTEWSLVCDSSYLSPLTTTIYFCGVMLGGLVFGHIADTFGRKPVMLVTLYLPVAVGVGIYFMPWYSGFAVLRFVQGVLMQGLQTSFYALAMEILPHHRSYAGAVLECFWGTGVMLIPLLAYLIQDWRYLQLAISLPSALAVFYICLMPESLRWLIIKNRLEDAEKLINRICSWNKLPFPKEEFDEIKQQLENKENKAKKHSVVDLMKNATLRKRSFILYYIWFAISVGYYGLTWQLTSLPGDKYLNFFIAGSVEFLAYVSVIYVTNRFGRKRPLLTYFTLASILMVTAGVIPLAVSSSNASKIASGFAIAGKFAMGGLFAVIFIYTAELYPTAVRNIGMGSCAFWTRVGGVVAPQTIALDLKGNKSYPLILYGGVTLIGGLLTLMLPETLKIKLPDTMDEMDKKGGKAADLPVESFAEKNDSKDEIFDQRL